MAGGCRRRLLEELIALSVGVELAAAAGARTGPESATACEVSKLLRRTVRRSRTQPGRGVDHGGHTWRLAVAVAVAIALARLMLDVAHYAVDVVVGMRQSSVQDLMFQGSGGEKRLKGQGHYTTQPPLQTTAASAPISHQHCRTMLLPAMTPSERPARTWRAVGSLRVADTTLLQDDCTTSSRRRSKTGPEHDFAPLTSIPLLTTLALCLKSSVSTHRLCVAVGCSLRHSYQHHGKLAPGSAASRI